MARGAGGDKPSRAKKIAPVPNRAENGNAVRTGNRPIPRLSLQL
jgi:hypothetical protein